MTYVLKDVADRLLASSPITTQFGSGATARIYADFIPQGTDWAEAITLSTLSVEPVEYLGGEAGRHITILTVDVWTDGTGGEFRLNQLTELVRNRLNGFRGTIGTGSYGTIRMIRYNTVPVPIVDASDQHKRHASMDFEIIHSASIPTLS